MHNVRGPRSLWLALRIVSNSHVNFNTTGSALYYGDWYPVSHTGMHDTTTAFLRYPVHTSLHAVVREKTSLVFFCEAVIRH